jgi:hypothetical protein
MKVVIKMSDQHDAATALPTGLPQSRFGSGDTHFPRTKYNPGHPDCSHFTDYDAMRQFVSAQTGQAAVRWFLIRDAKVQFQDGVYALCGKQSDTGTGFQIAPPNHRSTSLPHSCYHPDHWGIGSVCLHEAAEARHSVLPNCEVPRMQQPCTFRGRNFAESGSFLIA